MTGESDVRALKKCFNNMIESINETINRIESSDTLNSSRTVINSILNKENDTFTLNEKDNELMDEFKMNIENLLENSFGYLSQTSKNYLINFLSQYEYNYDTKQFLNPFNRSILPSFLFDLQGILSSIDAFQAAWDGNLIIVKDFINNYPGFKDKPGIYGTTLLYSASRNNKINIVKYLIEFGKCSVNAQNEQHLEKFLSKSTQKNKSYQALPSAASTALHGACYNGYLDIVQYLINHGADYFIKNQAEETPIKNAQCHSNILEFFRNYLVLSYSIKTNDIPDDKIEDSKNIIDCKWEYKPFNTNSWFEFSSIESNELQNSLIINSNQEFKHEIFLRLRSTVYTVSIIQFLRSGRDADKENNLAWVRCRGSSILNFDSYALWQIMLIKHPLIQSDKSIPSLKIFNIPNIYNNQFKIQLNSWYNCHPKINSQLDNGINYRKKIISIYLDFISNDLFLFNLQTFSFSNEQSTIQGFIRWIPKFVLNNKSFIKQIDNFSTLNNSKVIPLTRIYYQQIIQANQNLLSHYQDSIEDENEDDYTINSIDHDNNKDQLNNQVFILFSIKNIFFLFSFFFFLFLVKSI